MHANITVELQSETGRQETIKNCRSVRTDPDQPIIEVKAQLPGTQDVVTEEYDALEWDVTDVYHTEIPITER
jgi:hypothetical protein